MPLEATAQVNSFALTDPDDSGITGGQPGPPEPSSGQLSVVVVTESVGASVLPVEGDVSTGMVPGVVAGARSAALVVDVAAVELVVEATVVGASLVLVALAVRESGDRTITCA